MTVQVCSVCNEAKLISEFSFRKDSGKYRPNCKACRSVEHAISRYTTTTVDEIEALRTLQDNKCAICGIGADAIEHASFIHSPLVLDHDHITGKLRGLLCPVCNMGLGQLDDNAARLTKAAAYLTAHDHAALAAQL